MTAVRGCDCTEATAYNRTLRSKEERVCCLRNSSSRSEVEITSQCCMSTAGLSGTGSFSRRMFRRRPFKYYFISECESASPDAELSATLQHRAGGSAGRMSPFSRAHRGVSAINAAAHRGQAGLLHFGGEPETGDAQQLEAVERAAEVDQHPVQQRHCQLQGAAGQAQVVLRAEVCTIDDGVRCMRRRKRARGLIVVSVNTVLEYWCESKGHRHTVLNCLLMSVLRLWPVAKKAVD